MVKRYGVEIPVKLFFSELDTPEKIATFVLQNIPHDFRQTLKSELALALPVTLPQFVSASSISVPAPTVAIGLEGIIQGQLDIMREQLAVLRGQPLALINTTSMPLVATKPVQVSKGIASVGNIAPLQKNTLRDITLHEEDVNVEQRAFIRQLTARIVEKTPKSRAYAERYRGVLADWIATLNFSLTTKEMAYPIVSAKSCGSRFWDIDGNEYVDTATGYGATFFGHNPDFITDAIRAQLDEGFELGPQSDIAGEVAELISELTGVERVSFCNSGTEAVMVAVRLARAVTRRKKFVRFINSYHGSFDGVLAEAGENGAEPMAPGIIESMVEDTIVLHYGSPESLEAIRAIGNDLAAVLVEPVQSRNPENYSQQYLQHLRDITSDMGAALIFDEMITGFRIHPGGAQAYFNICADIVTYGKVVGGGMPIGVVAGKALFMDSIDGGNWQFGDASGPSRETTFFAGTFCKHPLAMAAARAVLLKIKQEGIALMDGLNEMTQRFVERANAFFVDQEVPVRALRFGSMYRFETKNSRDPARSSLEMNLLFRHMALDGVFFWERRTAFFSLAHTEEDAERILLAVQRATTALRAGGFSFCSAHSPSETRGSKHTSVMVSASIQSFPLSSEERRMYVLSLMKGGEDAYHVSGALRLTGVYDPARGERALRELAARHSTLRTAYVFQNGNIIHRTEESIVLPLNYYELEEQSLDSLLARIIQPFDLAQAPLWRAGLIRCSEREHVLLFDFHHLIADGISMSIMIEDLFRLYQAENLEAVPANYADFVQWERGFVGSAEFKRQLEYWLKTIKPLPPLLDLPADFSRPAQNDFVGETVRFTLGQAAHQGVRELAKTQRATPFMVLLCTYFIFLQKLTQQDDICIGTPFDRRRNGNFDRTVGMFAQTLLIRARPDPALNFSILLNQIKQACTDAYSNPDCSLEDILGQLDIERDFSRNPLFDTMFIYENGNRRLYNDASLTVDTLPVPLRGSPFDLTLEITEEQGVLHCSFVYAKRLFSHPTVQRWAAYFEYLLAQVIALPGNTIAEYQIVDDAERVLLLERFNDTARNGDPHETLVDNFRASAARNASNIALVFGDESWTYAELEQRTNVLACYLVAAGVAHGDLVGILMPRGTGMIAAMLAVLKAGAAYVPLDPDYPDARIKFMVEKSKIRVLLSKPEFAANFAFTGQVLDPDNLSNPGSSQEMPVALPSDLAYVIFTSGSTGNPKGVMLEHRSVVNFLHGMEKTLDLPTRPTTLGLTTISFDIFVLEVFLTFARGGCLVLAPESAQHDPKTLLALMHAHKVNVVQATPSRVQMILACSMAEQAFAGVQALLVGGEAFPEQLLSQLQAVPNLRIFNVYGPTETTVWSAVKDVTHAKTVTLGAPIANTRLYVLDSKHALRPLGCVGDLYIAGQGLARGYLDDAEKTAATFLADPFVAGERMYFTGDRAAWTSDGELVYHGRSDNQIKLRGYRIEIAEIESVLQGHLAVMQVAVTVKELAVGNAVLAAYCVPVADVAAQLNGTDFSIALRAYVANYLPNYMVPAVVVRIEAMPMTPNGKIDRRRLLELDVLSNASLEGETEFAPDELETEILAVWKRILGERPIGLHESFFDVGGNSFSLVAMHGALSEKYPGVLEVADIFANPTVVALKAQIVSRIGNSDPLVALEFPPDFFTSDDQSMQANTLVGQLDAEASQRLHEMAQRFEIETFELALTFYLFYLNKLLHVPSLELAAVFGKRPEYVLVGIDFAAVHSLGDLVAQVREFRQSERWIARKLSAQAVSPVRRQTHGVRVLFAAEGSAKHNERYGFDLVLRVKPHGETIHFSLDYDGARLDSTRMELFIINYLKLIKVLLSANVSTISSGGKSTAIAG